MVMLRSIVYVHACLNTKLQDIVVSLAFHDTKFANLFSAEVFARCADKIMRILE